MQRREWLLRPRYDACVWAPLVEICFRQISDSKRDASKLRPATRTSSSRFEEECSERGQGELEGVLAPMAGRGVAPPPPTFPPPAPAVDRRVAVEQLAPLAALGYPDAVALADHRRVVQHGEHDLAVLR